LSLLVGSSDAMAEPSPCSSSARAFTRTSKSRRPKTGSPGGAICIPVSLRGSGKSSGMGYSPAGNATMGGIGSRENACVKTSTRSRSEKSRLDRGIQPNGQGRCGFDVGEVAKHRFPITSNKDDVQKGRQHLVNGGVRGSVKAQRPRQVLQLENRGRAKPGDVDNFSQSIAYQSNSTDNQ
jgi:hypothetical protein